ncbi:MAG TPA: DUF6152 family protein [Bryobacteraceae bacterium]
MRFARSVLFLAAGMVIGAGPTLAHHALATEYDLNRSVTVVGTVTKVEWTNPHVRLYLDTHASDRSDPMHWEFEMASPNWLMLNGLKIDSLRIGDRVTITAYPARNGSDLGYALKVSHGAHIEP